MTKIITTDWTGCAPAWAAWTATDDTYDGAPDSATRNQIGYGTTPEEATADLERMQLEEACFHECNDDECQFACTNGGRCPLEI